MAWPTNRGWYVDSRLVRPSVTKLPIPEDQFVDFLWIQWRGGGRVCKKYFKSFLSYRLLRSNASFHASLFY